MTQIGRWEPKENMYRRFRRVFGILNWISKYIVSLKQDQKALRKENENHAALDQLEIDEMQGYNMAGTLSLSELYGKSFPLSNTCEIF